MRLGYESEVAVFNPILYLVPRSSLTSRLPFTIAVGVDPRRSTLGFHSHASRTTRTHGALVTVKARLQAAS